MNKITISWYEFWSKRRWLFFILLGCVVAIELFSIQFLNPQQNIADTVPETELFEKYAEIVEHKGLNSTLFLSFEPKSEQNSSEELLDLASQFKGDVESICQDEVENVNFQLSEDGFDFYHFIDEQLPWLLSESDYGTIENRILSDSIRKRVLANHQKLFTPEGFALKEILINDPLQFNTLVLNKLLKLSDESIFEERDGVMYLKGSESVLFTSSLTFEASDGEQGEQLYAHLEELKAKWEDRAEVDFFSSVLIAAANSRQIKADTALTITISLVGLALLFMFYYRSVVVPIYFVLTIGLGIGFALALLSLFHREISGIAIGATAVVLGMVMDYSFHFFTHLKHSPSVKETLKAVSNPLYIGCFTTVLAFGALLFTNSPVLQDFGLFAALCLIGAVISVTFITPLLITDKLIEKWKKITPKTFNFQFGKNAKRVGVVVVIGFTIFTFIKASDVSFDDNLFNLSYFPEELQEAEVKFRKIDGQNQRRIFILSEGDTKLLAQEADYETFKKLESLKEKGRIDAFVSSSAWDVPEEEKAQRLNDWNIFWQGNAAKLQLTLDSLESELDYYSSTFDGFENKTSGEYAPDLTTEMPSVFTEFKKLVSETDDGWVAVSYFTVSLDEKSAVISELKSELSNSSPIDRSAIANELILSVKSDFNFILIISSLLVLITLIVVYGRIELALITFIPMVISWIWILGMVAMFDIKFNMVNIVICTFIFGLGDDFAVFLTDGHIKKFARNENALGSYKKGILLSALSTLIGIGALIFAQHPALYSIAAISILGMVTIVVVSFLVQPYLLRILMLNRKEKRLPPITLVNLMTTIISFSLFLTGCLMMWPIQLVFRIIPFGQRKLKRVFHTMMQKVSWLNIHAMVNVKKVFHNKERLDFDKPSVIIANHQSFIDVLLMISINPKLVVMTNDWVYRSPIFGAQVKYLDFFPGAWGLEENEEHLGRMLSEGYSILIFPEGTRSKDKEIGRFHKGAFHLAEKFQMDITPIILHGFNDAMRKKDYILQNGVINIAVLPRISWDDPRFGETRRERTKSISAYMKEEFKKFDREHSDSKYLGQKIISNYIYKSPITEWYVKVKWWLERKNYDQYHDLIPYEGEVLDLGCGYGYMTYYLQLRSTDRMLTGVDYDENKIQLAENCWVKNDQINFVCADITTFEFKTYRAIILADTLHYLTPEGQSALLDKCVEHLTADGVLLIRDGITSDEGHKRTEFTEKYSTKRMKFNKTTNELSFFSKDFIVDFAKEKGLSVEHVDQGKQSSNTLFVLKK